MSQYETAHSVVEITSAARLFPDLAEVWRYRALALTFARRNIKTRFTQTILGRAWLILQPLPLAAVLTVILGKLLNVPSDGVPYALFVCIGTALWSAFSRSVSEASTSLVASGALLSKVYFPRLIVPVSTFLTAIFDALPIFVLLIILSVYFERFPGWPILLSPVFLLLALTMAFAVGLWITVLDAFYRDVRVLLPYALQLGFYLSPVMYSTSLVPDRWHTLYHLNPLVGILQGFRWSLVAGIPAPEPFDIVWALALAVLLLITGLTVFARLERVVVDRI